eukprot:372644-Alexandrium_andersonii.AAC.1
MHKTNSWSRRCVGSKITPAPWPRHPEDLRKDLSRIDCGCGRPRLPPIGPFPTRARRSVAARTPQTP